MQLDAAKIKELIVKDLPDVLSFLGKEVNFQSDFQVRELFEAKENTVQIPFLKAVDLGSDVPPGFTPECAQLTRGAVAVCVVESAEITKHDSANDVMAEQFVRKLTEYMFGKLLHHALNTPNKPTESEYLTIIENNKPVTLVTHSAVFAKYFVPTLPVNVRLVLLDMATHHKGVYNSYILSDGALACFYNLDEIQVTVENDRYDGEPSTTIILNTVFATHLYGYDAKTGKVITEPGNIKVWVVEHTL